MNVLSYYTAKVGIDPPGKLQLSSYDGVATNEQYVENHVNIEI